MKTAASWVRHMWLSIIPHPHNDHRPYALRHAPLASLASLLVVAKIATIGIIAVTPATADLATITAARIIQLTNEERRQAGLPELQTNSLLSSAATQKGNHMLEQDYFAHISPDGVTPWFWMKKVGYQYQTAGENLAVDFTEAEAVVAAWMASPSHKENLLLPDYAEIGVGVVTGEFQGATSTVVVQMFGLPSASSALGAKVVAPKITSPPPPSPTPSLSPTPSPTPTPAPITPPAPPTPRIAVLGPTTDYPQVVWQLSSGQYAPVPSTFSWQPNFINSSSSQSDITAPARFSQLFRRLAVSLGIVITILLTLAIIIRIRIQHPALIAHASLVALLAFTLLFL